MVSKHESGVQTRLPAIFYFRALAAKGNINRMVEEYLWNPNQKHMQRMEIQEVEILLKSGDWSTPIQLSPQKKNPNMNGNKLSQIIWEIFLKYTKHK